MAAAASRTGEPSTTRAKRRASHSGGLNASVCAVEAAPAKPVRRARPLPITKSMSGLGGVAPCGELDALRALTPEQARAHIRSYLHTVMPDDLADAFEPLAFRWELHLVALDEIQLVRGVDLDQEKATRYRKALRRARPFPPLIGLGGDVESTRDVLLCDGYHRAIAMRDAGYHSAWMWLAASPWHEESVLAGIPARAATR